MAFKLLFVFTILLGLGKAEFLRVENRDFYYGDQKVFLSGPNLAWYNYGYDFGNGQYEANTGVTLKSWIDDIANAGGNTLRIWLHVEADNTPEFNSEGYVIGIDRTGSIIRELSDFLDYAANKNVFVIPVLWNGALMRSDRYQNLVSDESKLNSYIENALRPMVRALASKPALASWEIMNEPEGSIRIEANSNPCYDTVLLGRYGAGWTGTDIPMELFLRFINLQAAAIHEEDSKSLVTLGSWSEHPQSDAFADTFNYYKDSCLIGAGNQSQGTIDYYQIHTYSWEGQWGQNSPFKVQAGDYSLDKPLIIGEFSSVCAMDEGIEALFGYAYNSGYNGVLSWQYNAGGHCSDDQPTQQRGMEYIRDWSHGGSIIPVEIQ